MEQLVDAHDELRRPPERLHDADERLRPKVSQNKHEQVVPHRLAETFAKDAAPFDMLKRGRILATVELGVRLGTEIRYIRTINL